MALVVNLKTIEYLKGRYDRIVRITFRGKTLQSNIVRNAKRVAFFGQSFEWPIARAIEPSESLEILVFNYSKYLMDKLVGSYVLILQQLIQSGQLNISESLVDKNNKVIPATVTFDLYYTSPGGDVGSWAQRFASEGHQFGAEIEESSEIMAEERAMVEKLQQQLEENGESERAMEDSGDDNVSQTYLMDNLSTDKGPQTNYVDLQLDRPKDFEVVVTIIEGQQLSGVDIDPVVKIEVNDQAKYTSIRQSTNEPYYNEYFVFNFTEMPAVFFDKLFSISAYHSYALPGRHILRSGNMVAAKRLIGTFRCDLGMIYTAPDHQFYHKWAVLLDLKDFDSGPKGYIKCDIAITGRGQSLKIPRNLKESEDSIEANLLLPQGVRSTRHKAVYSLSIYKAEELPQTDLGIIASMHKALTNKDVAYIDACVRVSFGGQVGKTSVIKSYYPEWNECMKFMDMFPPLCSRFKVQLCDQDGLMVEPVATHFIEMSQIMDAGGSQDGILPTFGPTWVNMYGTTRGFRILKDGTEDLNEGKGEGPAFRGRLLMSLRTTVDPTEMATEGSSKVIIEKLRTGLSEHAPKKTFLLFASIFEASMIDAKLAKKAIQFEISIGQYGNILDGRSTSKTPLPDVMGDGEEEEEDDGALAGVPALKQQLMRRQKTLETNLPCRSMTPRKIMQQTNRDYGHLPLDDDKPCLFVVSLFEDIRKRLLHSNILSRISENLEGGLSDVRERMGRSDPEAHRRFKGVMEKLKVDCSAYLGMAFGVGPGSGKTKLDQYRIKSSKRYAEELRRRADALKQSTTAANLKEKLQSVLDVPLKIRNYAKDPQHSLPDVILWMLCDDERVAYYRFPVRDLFYSSDPYCVGKNCGKRQTIFLKKPGKKSYGQQGWMIQAKLNIFIWMGDVEPLVQRYMEGLPAGFEPVPHKDNPTLPPVAVVYSTWRRYQFRAYVHQARSLIPSDETGLSDPFARILVCNRVANTQVIMESLSPTWDETIVVDSIILYGDPRDIKTSPPLVVVEIYDYDTLSQPEFLGRAIVSPKFNLVDSEYDQPKLEWCDLFRGPHKAGQLLASFEFIEIIEGHLPPYPPTKEAGGKVLTNKEKMPLYSVPLTIKPNTSKHRLEILFRGVRELKKIQLTSVDHPHVMVDCSGQVRYSDRIVDMDKSCNFESFLKVIDLDLPDERIFWPPLTIRCFETRSFGRSLMVGIHTINNIEIFVYKDHRNLEELQRILAEMLAEQSATGGEGTLSNGQPLLSIEDAQSRRTVLSAKSAKSALSAQSAKSAKSAKSNTSQQESKASGELEATADSLQKGFFPADLMDSGVGLAVEPAPNDAFLVGRSSRHKRKDLEVKTPDQATFEEKAKERELRRVRILELDWWSKYFASKDDIARITKILERNKESNDQDADKENYGWTAPDYTVINMEGFGKHVEVLKLRALELERAEKKKKRKRFTRRRLKRKFKKMKGRLNDAFAGGEIQEENDDGEESGDEYPVEDNSYIERLVLLPCGLEEVPEINQFNKPFRTFQLYRGKKGDDDKNESERFSGLFKGQFCIYKLEEETETPTIPPSGYIDKIPTGMTTEDERSNYRLSRYMPTHKKVEVKVLVYILKATDLHPLDLDGRADPYLILKCGKHKIVDKDNRIDNQLNPIFGRLFQIDAVFPLDSFLKIEIWDYDSMSSDELIGETTIDLEDRYFCHHMTRCAIQQKYETFGYNTWRNPLKPSQLLESFCKEYGYPKPTYNPSEVKIGEYVTITADGEEEMYEETESGDLKPTIEHLALKALKKWHTIPGGWPLVPEHVESRPLFCDARPGIEQGHLEMWIDMFPKDSPKLPASIDITPRTPKSYELRCIIWNTDEVILDDVNFLTGEASSDIFVKGFIKGVGVDDMKTDIHYRSLTGEGNFNWRFVFNFDYLKAENKVIYNKKEHVLATDEVEHRVPPLFHVQVWDADIVTADDFLGSIVLDLLRIPRPSKNVKKCSLKMIEDDSHPRLNIFKNKRCKGWWPVATREKPEKSDDDDSDDDEDEMEKLILKGKVEMELELLTLEEAEKNPVGIAHKEPEALPNPNRPDTSFLWFMNPLKTLKYIIWKNYKWLILKLLILALIITFLVLFFYNFPGAFVNKILSV